MKRLYSPVYVDPSLVLDVLASHFTCHCTSSPSSRCRQGEQPQFSHSPFSHTSYRLPQQSHTGNDMIVHGRSLLAGVMSWYVLMSWCVLMSSRLSVPLIGSCSVSYWLCHWWGQALRSLLRAGLVLPLASSSLNPIRGSASPGLPCVCSTDWATFSIPYCTGHILCVL